MSIEVLDFHIKAFIKDKSNQITELNKKVSLKIDWRTDSLYGTRGYLNPEWDKYFRITDGKHDPNKDCWRGKGEVIQFEKDGQKYDILVNFVVKKGLFKDKVMDEKFEAFPSDYSYYKTRDAPFTCGTGYDRYERNQMKHSVIPAKRRKEGYILVGGIVVFIIAFLFGKNKKKKSLKEEDRKFYFYSGCFKKNSVREKFKKK